MIQNVRTAATEAVKIEMTDRNQLEKARIAFSRERPWTTQKRCPGMLKSNAFLRPRRRQFWRHQHIGEYADALSGDTAEIVCSS